MKNKIVTLKVSLDKKIYRVIEVDANNTLYALAETMLDAFRFDMDHAFGFYSNVDGHYSDSGKKYELFTDLEGCAVDEDSKSVRDMRICDVFEPKEKMLFLFDYGDKWPFIVQCKGFSEALSKIKYPRIIEKMGTAPKQYQNYAG